jgi:KUP system potassium uptake protein
VELVPVSPLFIRVTLRFGFMETPNVPRALGIARKLGWHFDIMSTSFFLSRRALKPQARAGISRWEDRLFIALAGQPTMRRISSIYLPAAWSRSARR